MTKDELKTFIKILVRQNRSTAARYHLMYEEGYSESSALQFIREVKEVVDREAYA